MSIDPGRDSPGHCSCDTVSGPGPSSCLCSVGWEVLPYWSPSSNVSSIKMKMLCWFPRVWLWGAQSAPLLGATLWPGINAAVQCLSQATRWFGHTKSGWNRGRECRLVLFLWPQFGIYKAKKKKLNSKFWTWLPVKFCFYTSNKSVWKRPFQREVWSAPFICFLWLTGVTWHPLNPPALWHCWTEALASERQGSSGDSSAPDKVMSS